MTEGEQARAEELVRVFRQVVGVVLISWQRIFRVGLFSAVLAILMTETVACEITGAFPPPPSTHLVAGALALVLGYGVSLTMLIGMLLKGGMSLIRQLEGDVEIGAHAASVFAQREVGDLGAGIRRFFGKGNAEAKTTIIRSNIRPIGKPRPAIATRNVAVASVVAAVGRDVARNIVFPDTQDAFPPPLSAKPDTRRDPDDANMRTPAPAFQSLPVLAAQLPRIEWTYDDRVLPRPLAPSPTPPDREQDLVFVAPLSANTAHAPEAPDVHDVPESVEATGRTPDVPGLIPRGWYRAASVTRPLPAVTRPISKVTQPIFASETARTSGGVHSGGLWERFSQALVGQPGAPEPESADHKDHKDHKDQDDDIDRQLPLSEVTPDNA